MSIIEKNSCLFYKHNVCGVDIYVVRIYNGKMNSCDIYQELGKMIKRYRQGEGRTQTQLAAQIGISRASLANIEAGRQQVLVHHLFDIAQALDIESLDTLLSPKKIKRLSKKPSSSLRVNSANLSKKQLEEVFRVIEDA